MKITFNIHYNAPRGAALKLICAGAEFALNPLPDGYWTATIDNAASTFDYGYGVFEDDKLIKREWPLTPRRLSFAADSPSWAMVFDMWRDMPLDSYLDTGAAHYALVPRKHAAATAEVYPRPVTFRARCANIKDGERLLLVTCRDWDPANGSELREETINEWAVTLDASKINFPLEYKFVIQDAKGDYIWQAGPNLRLERPAGAANGAALVINDLRPAFYRASPKAAGIVLPVFSLRSESSFGAGDFGDIKKLADWAALTGQKIIQLLPINDTTITNTWTDSYPYNSISIYALHPLYMDLNALPVKYDAALQKELNANTDVDYERVTAAKRKYIKEAFEKEGAEVFKTDAFKKFFEQNSGWLVNYSVFSYLRDTYGTADFKKWPRYGVFDKTQVQALFAKAQAETGYYCYMQYKLHEQLLDAAGYARLKGIVLKGDIPIGISPSSVEAWAEPALFYMDSQAGCPPDDFSAKGQNWGFPTYNWDKMALDGYQWWVNRMRRMAQYFDAYRIDHVLGFFRIWDIPMHSVHGLLGQFSPALPMSKEEILSFGIDFKPEFLKPYISGQMLEDIFGADAAQIKENYLNPLPGGLFEMKPQFDAQRKVQALAIDADLKENLYSLISNVLFVRDKNNPALYHPRISAPDDYYFKALPPRERQAFTGLYNHYFYERNNNFWRDCAMKKLPAVIESTSMLVCAEDLGMIPASAEGVMKELKMLSLEIQRMPKTPGLLFGDARHYSYMSVCTPSTHDMSTLRGWWKEDAAKTQYFYNNILGLSGAAPETAGAEICERIVNMHLESPSMLVLISFQDWAAIDDSLRRGDDDINAERINVPAIARYYWRYRMHITLEQLMKESAFNARVFMLIRGSGR